MKRAHHRTKSFVLFTLVGVLLPCAAGCIVYFEDEEYDITYRLHASRIPIKVLYRDANGDTVRVMSENQLWEQHLVVPRGEPLLLGANHSHPRAVVTRPQRVELTILLEGETRAHEAFDVPGNGTAWLSSDAR